MNYTVRNLKRPRSEEGSSSSRLPPRLRRKNAAAVSAPNPLLTTERPTSELDCHGPHQSMDNTTEGNVVALPTVPRTTNSDGVLLSTISCILERPLQHPLDTNRVEEAECLAVLLPAASSISSQAASYRAMDGNTSPFDTRALAHICNPAISDIRGVAGYSPERTSDGISLGLRSAPYFESSGSDASNRCGQQRDTSSASDSGDKGKQESSNLRRRVLSELVEQCAESINIVTNLYFGPLFTSASDRTPCSSASSESAHSCCPANHWNPQFWEEWFNSWHPLEGQIELEVLLGTGRSGAVYRGKFNGAPVAFKLCPISNPAMVVAEVHNEVTIYNTLSDLQGHDIPRLFCHGLLTIYSQLQMALVLELIVDRIQVGNNEYRRNAIEKQCPLGARYAALEALGRVHAAGVLQGDPRAENILFQRDHESSDVVELQPKLIDFAFASMNKSSEKFFQEKYDWSDVLNIH
ncbi:hypothetical protein GGH92_001686 [Coemansia sp. RSA 2673]|nr:hypothetical protein GGH92_001686 [Coemansia sp. RSA 2673]